MAFGNSGHSVGARSTSGASGGQIQANQNSENSNGDTGLLAKLGKLFSGKDQETQNLDPWAADEASAAAQAEATANQAQKLEDFTSLFEPKADPNADPATQPSDPFASLTKENLAKAAGNLDFSNAVPEELVSKALSGDAQAFRQAINGAIQAAFVESMSGANTLSQKRIDHAIESKIEKLVAQRLADHDINSTVSKNPLLSNPATKPIRDALTSQIRSANPGISASELNNQLTGYLTAFAASVNPGSQNQSSAPTSGQRQRISPQEDAMNF